MSYNELPNNPSPEGVQSDPMAELLEGLPLASISRRDWSFDHRGEQDRARHNEKIKDAIRDNLDEVISDGSIITADPKSKKMVKVPMRAMELPRFKYGSPKDGLGVGDGSEQPGDIVGMDPDEAWGEEPGDEPGEEYYEAELTIEELQEMVFADLGLPRMKPKGRDMIESDTYRFDDIRHHRTPTNLDIMRTVMENLKRNAQETGVAEVKDINQDDYRVKRWEVESRPENSAVVIAMADISGSMGDEEKYITRAFCWWTVNFLRSKYPKVDIAFVAHDTEAYEVTEEQFFTRGTGGGTLCSSANKKALDLIAERYPADRYNIYPLHFSDGDNWDYDNETCVEYVQQLLAKDISQYAYVQIDTRGMGRSKLLDEYSQNISDERFKGLTIGDRYDVLEALKKVFSLKEAA